MKRLTPFLLGLGSGVLAGAFAVYLLLVSPPDVADPPPAARTFGWHPDPVAVDRVVAGMATPYFSDAGFRILQDTPEQDVLPWQFFAQVAGQEYASHDQDGVGCCVGEGFATALEFLQAFQMKAGAAIEYKRVACESIYALSRVEVGGGRIRGDGSVGAWAAKAVKDYGVLFREKYGDYDLAAFSPDRARLWGRNGLPDTLEATAKKYLVKTTALVRGSEEARVALANGYPVAVCSDQGFTTRRDADGFCYAKGTWNHCMAVVGYRKDRRAFLVVNSWGDDAAAGPLTLGQPRCSFWVKWETLDRMLRQGDSWALSAFDGFPARKIDWFVLNPKEGVRWPASRFSLVP